MPIRRQLPIAIFVLALVLGAGCLALAQSQADGSASASEGSDKAGKISAANQFNRLLKKSIGDSHPPPSQDGIHDPGNPGTDLLQAPEEAFAGLPQARGGNGVDWMKALQEQVIKPWYNLDDPDAEPFEMDLNIVRQVRGSMPNVIYPHQPHTEWLDCADCHDSIFVPEKGANQMSMAAILLGQKCGVCHGKVAFPVTDCRRCHAQAKTVDELRKIAEESEWSK